MTNPGSLTMGFAGVHPRQLAPSVGTTQVGIPISAVPSPASRNSRARTRCNLPEEFKITANISAAPARSLSPQPCQDQYYGVNRARRQRRRTQRPKRKARGFYTDTPIDELQHEEEDLPATRRPTSTQEPAAQQDTDSELEISDRQDHCQQGRNRRPKRQARGSYEATPPDESNYTAARSPTTRRPAAMQTATTRQDSDSETRTGEYYNPD